MLCEIIPARSAEKIRDVNAGTLEELLDALEQRAREQVSSFSTTPPYQPQNQAVQRQLQEIERVKAEVEKALDNLEGHYRRATSTAQKAIDSGAEFDERVRQVTLITKLIKERDRLPGRSQRY